MKKYSDVFLYKGSDVNNELADYLIDVIYKEKKLLPINEEIKLKKSKIDSITNLIDKTD